MSHLHRAARLGKYEEVADCLTQGLDVNALSVRHDSALMLASEEGHLEIVYLLLKEGADVSAGKPGGRTALHRAAGKGHLDIVMALVAHGADVNAVSPFGWSPAIEAALCNHHEVVSFLLSHGGDATLQDHKGRTAEDWLAIGGIRGEYDQHHQRPESRAHATHSVRKLMEREPSAEAFAAKHGRNTLVWSYGSYAYEDAEVERWARRVSEILFTPGLLDECEERYLTGEELEEARKCRAKRTRLAERRARQEAERTA